MAEIIPLFDPRRLAATAWKTLALKLAQPHYPTEANPPAARPPLQSRAEMRPTPLATPEPSPQAENLQSA
jgi:hypothetical protein